MTRAAFVLVALLLAAAPRATQAACNCSDGVLASGGMGHVEGVAVDETYAYFGSEDQFLRRVAKIGGGVPDILAHAPLPIGRVSADDANVYFTTFTDRNIEGNGGLYVVGKNGGEPTQLASGRIYDMAIDSGFVYWTDFNGALYRIAKSGGARQQLAAPSFPLGLLLDGNDVYYSDAGAQRVLRVAKSGGTPAVVAEGVVVNFLTTDGTYLYMSGLLAPGILKVAKSGGTPTTLATGQTFASGIGYVNGLVYTALDDNIGPNGSLMSIDPNSGATKTVRANRFAAHVFTWDACAIYLTDWNDNGTVEKICVGGSSTTAPVRRRAARH